ncbi:hypothetical protein Tco_0500552 [Tanacetum coccineum]
MTTLAEHIIVARVENRPPMLVKSMYDSWATRIRLFIKGKKHSRMMLDSIDNGPLVYLTIEENGQTRPKKYSEPIEAQQLQDDCDVQAMNIILHGLPPDVYALVNHQEISLNQWSMFVTDVKLGSYHAWNDIRSLALVAHSQLLYNPSQSPQHSDSSLVVPMFQQGEDLIECINKAMTFLSAVASRVIVQQSQGRQNQSYVDTRNIGISTASKGNFAAGQSRVVKCYNCQGEGHMTRQSCQILDEEQLAFLADSRISEALDVQKMQYSKQTHIDDFHDNEIHSDSNIIPYSQYLQESQDAVIQDTNLLFTLMIIGANLLDLNKREQLIDSQMDDLVRNRNAKLVDFQQDIDTLKKTLSNHVKEKDSLSKTLTVFKTESKEKESKYIDKEIILEKQNKELDNIISLGYQNSFHLKKAQWNQPTLYDGSVIAKEHAVISVIDDEETLILEEESRSKMLDKQNDPMLKEDFGKRFVTQKELCAEQAFWLKHLSLSETPVTSHTPVRIEAPSELPKVSLVNESLKKLKYQLANFDKVVKKRLTSDAITAGSWGFKHTKECLLTEIIPFLKVLKDTFNAFDKTLLDEKYEVQTVFNQMKVVVDQCSVDKNVFEIQIKQLRIDNYQLLNQIMSQEIVHIVVNYVDILDVKKSCVNDCDKYLELETEFFKKKDFIEKEACDKLVKTQSQEKNTVIRKLKDIIKSLSEKEGVENAKKDIGEIETINIELEHNVAKLFSENKNLRKEREHLKSIYKDQFDSIRKTRGQSKEHCDSLIAQINAKSVENSNLNAQLQEKVFAITTLKNELRKLKGKNVVNTVVLKPNATVAPGMFKLDIKPISPRLLEQ